MKGTALNNLGKIEKNKNVEEGECIFPFKYKRQSHSKCFDTPKGEICATSVNDKGTLKKYGYCHINSTPKTLKIKLNKNSSVKRSKKNMPVTTRSSSSKSSQKSNQKSLTEKSSTKDSDKNVLKQTSQNRIMKTETSEKKRLNETFISAMNELNDIFMRKGEPFRARAYKKAEETIMLQPDDIYDYNVLKGLPNIGETILSKFKELQETGTLKILEKERNDPLQLFTKIHGIGSKKAQVIIDSGVTSIDGLKENQHLLNDNQKLGLKYYDDISKRIPRTVIEEYEKQFIYIFDEFENVEFDIVGSYRRGAKSSGDIDIIVSHKEDDQQCFTKILDRLKEKGIILEFLSKGKVKSLTITKIGEDIARRVDFLYTPQKEKSFAILYFTGSKGFNTVMRHRALQLGYSLNEHGISKMNGKEKDKITFLDFPDEKSIFDFLKMEYRTPEARIDGRSVVSISGTPILTKKNKVIKKVKTSIKNKESASENKSKTRKNTRTNKFINEFRKDGIKYLNKVTESQLIDMIKEANDAFFNDMSIITDSEYDIIKEYTEKTYPKNTKLQDIGAPVVDKNKVELPYYMGSMDKIKPDTDAIDKWKTKYKGPYVISAKLDGVSGLYSTENGVSKLYTRGNGKIGQDISYFIPYLRLPENKDITIRGEFIINRNIFDEKYKKSFSNPRNFVSGMINSKTIDVEKFKDIEFVAYEVIKPILSPQAQMKFLDESNVTNVIFEMKENVSNEELSDVLVNWRNNYKYESDGIIVTNDKIYSREDKNPQHSFAFKMVLSEQIAEAKVVDIIWNVSKDGLLKPKVQIEPVKLGGATIQYATGHNAATVVSNKLGVGAIIKIIRSGDVIPYIMETIVPAETIKMPDVEYVWNETNVDIELVNKSDNKEVLNKNITGFFTGIKVDGLSSGNITRIINAGYNSVSKIIKMTKEDFLKVEGFKEKLATKIYDSIQSKLLESELYTIMTASNIFGHGFGEKKMKLIMTEYQDILTSNESASAKVTKLTNIKGMAKKTAQAFVDNIPTMIQFLDETLLKYKLSESKHIIAVEYDTEHVLYAKAIVFTGIREKELMQTLENKYNVKLSSSVSKNTFAIIAKSKDEDSSKLSKARSLNIPIYEIDEFKKEYKV